jgi:hypothetical protein
VVLRVVSPSNAEQDFSKYSSSVGRNYVLMLRLYFTKYFSKYSSSVGRNYVLMLRLYFTKFFSKYSSSVASNYVLMLRLYFTLIFVSLISSEMFLGCASHQNHIFISGLSLV